MRCSRLQSRSGWRSATTTWCTSASAASDLGPRLALQALAPQVLPDAPRLHFVANMDGHELAAVLRGLKPERTLFIVASKSFGTAETLRNATSARAWFEAQGGTDLAAHFVALTARPDAAREFGVGRCFAFDDGVGGRTSLWSVIGLPVAVAIGRAGFEALLAGAHAMDRHFAEAPLEANLPVQLGLLDVWYRNFHRFGSRCVVPYHHGLRSLAFYLQPGDGEQRQAGPGGSGTARSAYVNDHQCSGQINYVWRLAAQPAATVAVPTMGEWGLALLASLAALAGLLQLRRRR